MEAKTSCNESAGIGDVLLTVRRAKVGVTLRLENELADVYAGMIADGIEPKTALAYTVAPVIANALGLEPAP